MPARKSRQSAPSQTARAKPRPAKPARAPAAANPAARAHLHAMLTDLNRDADRLLVGADRLLDKLS